MPNLRLAATVLLALPSAAQEASLEERIANALDRSRPVLLEHLGEAHRGYLGLLCLAALHDGVPPDDPALEAALGRLFATPLDRTYDLALRLMVLEELPNREDRVARAGRDVRRLLENRREGGFAYAPGHGGTDLSNTQYAALGLRSAEAIGVDVPGRVWLVLLRAILAAQNRDGGFGYTPGHESYLSMTVAGVGVLELCGQYGPETKTPRRAIEKALDRAWQWLAEHRAEIGSPATRWPFYAHYGLERAAVLSDKAVVGDVDWYATGARMLLDLETGSGGWSQAAVGRKRTAETRPDPVSTAFAVLFLRRKFRRFAGPVTGAESFTVERLSPRATPAQVARAVEAAVAGGSAGIPELLKALSSPVATRRRAAVEALERIAGRSFDVDPEADPESAAARAAVHMAELWWFREGRLRTDRPTDDRRAEDRR